MLVALLFAGCALMDAAKPDPLGDGDSDSDSDTGTGSDTATDTDTGTPTDTDTGSDTDSTCTEVDLDPRICEDQADHTAECKSRWRDYEASSCDPIDQCGCELPQACYPAYDPRGNADGSVECADPGAGAVGDPCGAHDECGVGLFCAPALLSGEGQETCQQPCDDPCDCPEGQICLGYIPPFCRTPDECDPTEGEAACPIGRTCVFVSDITNRTKTTVCIPSQGHDEGTACTYINDCGPGLACDVGNVCRRYCDSSDDCVAGEDCIAIGEISGCGIVVSACRP